MPRILPPGRARVVAVSAVFLAALTLAGCSEGPKIVPVSGIVTLDGQPLMGGECLPFCLGNLQLGDRAATIYRDAGTGEITVVDD